MKPSGALIDIYKISKIIRALWLAERRVCMRICKHGCGVKIFCFSRANHASTNLKKVLSWKTLQVYFISPSVETWHIFRNMLGQFIFSWADILSEKNPYFGKHLFFGKQRLITRTIFACKTSRLVTISILINGLNKIVLHFFSGKLFYKSNRKFFSCVCIAWYKHSRGWENSRRLRKNETKSRVCISVSNSPILGDPGAVGRAGRKGAQKFSSTLSSRLLTRPDWQPLGLRGWNSPNPSRVYIRLCKHGKRFLLLKSIPQGNVWRSVLRICKWVVGFTLVSIVLLACERQTFLLAYRHWGTFREEERRSSSRNVPQRRWARRNVCRSQATVLRKSVRFFIINILYYKKKLSRLKSGKWFRKCFFPNFRA